jgi:hypothetical protein
MEANDYYSKLHSAKQRCSMQSSLEVLKEAEQHHLNQPSSLPPHLRETTTIFHLDEDLVPD